MRLVLLGPPGSGKGTQAEQLAGHLHAAHISTGDLFRSHLRDGTPLGRKAQAYLAAGELVPDGITVGMVREHLSTDPTEHFILDGFPRNPGQARELDRMLAESDARLDAVVEFVVPEPVLVQRLLGRGRPDDTEDVIRRRLDVYRDDTAPLLQFYGDLVVSIDAVGDVPDITRRVLEAVGARA